MLASVARNRMRLPPFAEGERRHRRILGYWSGPEARRLLVPPVRAHPMGTSRRVRFVLCSRVEKASFHVVRLQELAERGAAPQPLDHVAFGSINVEDVLKFLRMSGENFARAEA